MTESINAGKAVMSTPVLRQGDRGDAVTELQRGLTEAGFDTRGIDGIFGPATKAALQAFQAARGLMADGIAGQQIWASLRRAVAAGQPTAPTTSPASNVTVNWENVDGSARMRYVMERLMDHYSYPINAAAGIVGNLWAESGVLPNRIEGSTASAPMRARDFAGNTVDFTPKQVMNRNLSTKQGPLRPGVGLAQWTSANRRAGLFAHVYDGRRQGPDVLFNMDAQVDYLDHELRASYRRVHGVVSAADVSLNAASDEIVYNFEIPGSILDNGVKLSRSDSRVKEVFQARRANSKRALREHRTVH